MTNHSILWIIWLIVLPIRFFWQRILVWYAHHMAIRGRADHAIKVLNFGLVMPNFSRTSSKTVMRDKLTALLIKEQRFEEALGHFPLLPRSSKLILTEANLRWRLADQLAASGDHAASQGHLATVNAQLAYVPDDMETLQAKAENQRRHGNHTEAASYFHQALSLVPARETKLQGHLMTRLADAASRSGRNEDALKWAEKAIAVGPDDPWLVLAHRTAALSCIRMKQLGPAEQHLKAANAITDRMENPEPDFALTLAYAQLQRDAGQIAAAFATCEPVLKIESPQQRPALILLSSCYAVNGDFGHAREAMLHAAQTTPLKTPHLEQTSQVLIRQALAINALETDQSQIAAEHLQEALTLSANEASHNLLFRAIQAWYFAQTDKKDLARSILGELDIEYAQAKFEAATQIAICLNQGRAALALGDYGRSLHYWESMLGMECSPMMLTGLWYYWGECRRLMGDTEAARQGYQKSLALNIDTYRSRLARERLSALGSIG